MLRNVLKHETCANCRICCSFVKNDVWEAPVFSEQEIEEIEKKGIGRDRFLQQEDGNYIARYDFQTDTEILLCPCLDEERGCLLGEHKPFECSIWPLRIFENDKTAYLGLAEICPAFQGEGEKLLIHELEENGLRGRIMALKEKQNRMKPEKGYHRV